MGGVAKQLGVMLAMVAVILWCAAAMAVVTVQTPAQGRYYTGFSPHALATDSSGVPHAAYGGDHLYYAHEAGSSWVVETVDPAPGVGTDATIAVDDADTVHIAYWDQVNGVLKYARGRAGSWTIRNVGSTSGVKPHPAVAVWPDGHSAVSYLAGAVRVAYFDASGAPVGNEELAATGSGGTSAVVTPDSKLFVAFGSGNCLDVAERQITSWQVITVDCAVGTRATAGADPPILVSDGDANLAVAYNHWEFSASSLSYHRRLWMVERTAAGWGSPAKLTTADVAAGPALAAVANGRLHLAFLEGGTGKLQYGSRPPGGSWTWQTAVTAPGGWNLSLVVNKVGFPEILYQDAETYQVKWTVLSFGSWIKEQVDADSMDVGSAPALATDVDGHLHATFYRPLEPRLYLAENVSFPDQEEWMWYPLSGKADPGYFSISDSDPSGSAVTVGGDGRLHILYTYGQVKGAGVFRYDHLVLHHSSRPLDDPQASWDDEVVNTPGRVGGAVSLVADTTTLHAAYFDMSGSAVVHAWSSGSGWNSEVVETGVWSPGYLDLAEDSAGHLHLSYYDETEGDLNYATNRSGSWSATAVATSGDVGAFNAVTTDPAGHAYISFYDADNGDLSYASNASGSWQTSVLDTAGDVGRFTDIDRGPDGYLRISYYDATNRRLKVASNTLPGWVKAVWDEGGDVGKGTALAVDGGNHTHVVYYDAANRDLKYATDAHLCFDNDACSASEYCDHTGWPCDGLGVCQALPHFCTPFGSGVCGCNGLTYTNACLANLAATSVAYDGACSSTCTSSDGCGPGAYCDKAVGDCSGTGSCTVRPVSCAPLSAPVCGCNGQTYDNACEADRAGVPVDHPGACPTPCADNGDCDTNAFCDKPEGLCGGSGTCAVRPELCAPVTDPVCGCDGVTYDNPCLAAMGGVAIARRGSCPRACTDTPDCFSNEYCARAAGACNASGECTVAPALCLPVWSPVCSCDGITYSNACNAAQSGASVALYGACRACTTSADCQAGEMCGRPEGACATAGTCMPQPADCLPGGDVVCGCDRQSYVNACFAALGGVAVDYTGPCDLDGDGVPDDGDGDGVAGNHPCTGGSSTACDDNCVAVANANQLDSDGDGVGNVCDNCSQSPNGPLALDAGGNSQLDTDADGYGNTCDPDFTNNLNVDFADLAIMKSVFFTSNPDADLNGNGSVDFADLAILKSMFFGPPGPSGLVP